MRTRRDSIRIKEMKKRQIRKKYSDIYVYEENEESDVEYLSSEDTDDDEETSNENFFQRKRLDNEKIRNHLLIITDAMSSILNSQFFSMQIKVFSQKKFKFLIREHKKRTNQKQVKKMSQFCEIEFPVFQIEIVNKLFKSIKNFEFCECNKKRKNCGCKKRKKSFLCYPSASLIFVYLRNKQIKNKMKKKIIKSKAIEIRSINLKKCILKKHHATNCFVQYENQIINNRVHLNLNKMIGDLNICSTMNIDTKINENEKIFYFYKSPVKLLHIIDEIKNCMHKFLSS